MRRVRYQVACSLDGYIAGPEGEYDWIIMDPEIDFSALFEQFDTFLVGRRTFELFASGQGQTPGVKVAWHETGTPTDPDRVERQLQEPDREPSQRPVPVEGEPADDQRQRADDVGPWNADEAGRHRVGREGRA